MSSRDQNAPAHQAGMPEASQVKPYFEEDGCTIYHADCREVFDYIWASIRPFAMVLTDPPYGISLERAAIFGDSIPFDPKFMLGSEPLVIWGANNFSSRLPMGGWLCWDKRCSVEADRMYGSAFELAWCSDSSKFKMFRCLHGGVVNADGANQERYHPTQKPISLMEWCISIFKDSETVLDPFMGSGTTLRAAKDLGRKAIGIEIEEKYCEIAAKRLSQKVFDFSEARP